MAKRIFSTVLLWLGIFAVLWFFRTTGAVIAIAAVSVLTMRELYILLAASGYSPFSGMGMLFGALITMGPWTYERYGLQPQILLPLAVVACAIRIILERPPERRVDALTSTVFGIVYVSVLLQYLVRIVTPIANDMISPDGRLVLALWVIAVAKFCDVGALLTGLAIGRTPMAPLTSPKKTWEGAIGGVVVAMGIGALVAWLGRSVLPTAMTPVRAALIACPLAVVAIYSDLVESVIKRRAALKDSGAGIPGIGGIFDLSDSLILAAPVGYVLISRLT